MDAYSAEGVWWRPEAPQHRVPGTLTSDEDGVQLVVYGPLASAFHECGQQGERGLCGLGGPVVLVGQVGDPTGVWRPRGLHVWSGRSRVRHDSPMPGW